MSTSNDEKISECTQWNATFSQAKSLKKHMLSYVVDDSFVCRESHTNFIQVGKSTEDKFTQTRGNRLECIICDKPFTLKSNLTRHMKIHNQEKPFTCTECKAAFNDTGHLKTHMLVHTGEKSFQCSMCNKQFAHKCNLKRHIVAHSGERPHACTLCNATFTQSTSLKLHMVSHTGEKPFECTICNKRFSLKSSLKQHMVTHTKTSHLHAKTYSACSQTESSPQYVTHLL